MNKQRNYAGPNTIVSIKNFASTAVFTWQSRKYSLAKINYVSTTVCLLGIAIILELYGNSEYVAQV